MNLTLLIIPGWELLKQFALGEKERDKLLYQCKTQTECHNVETFT